MICEWFPCLNGDLGYLRSLTMTGSLYLPVDWLRNKKPKCTLKLSNLIQEVSFIESQYCTSKGHPKLNFKWLQIMNFKWHLLHKSLIVLLKLPVLLIKATRSHEDIQGEILEGLVARIVTPQSLTKLEEVLEQFPRPPPLEGMGSLVSAN